MKENGFELNENEELKIKLQLVNLHKKEDINEMANIIIGTRKELLEYKKRIYKARKMIFDNYGLLDKYGIEILDDILKGSENNDC